MQKFLFYSTRVSHLSECFLALTTPKKGQGKFGNGGEAKGGAVGERMERVEG